MFLIQICGDSNTGNSKKTGHRQIREITTTDKQGWDIHRWVIRVVETAGEHTRNKLGLTRQRKQNST